MRCTNRIVDLALLAGLMLGVTTAQAEQSQAAVAWDQYIESSGVSVVLDQANGLIEQEIRNLEKAPLGFTPDQLTTIRDQLREHLGSERLKRDIASRLQRDFSPQQLQQLSAVLGSRSLRQLQGLQQQLEDAEVRQAMRSYRIKVKEQSPNEMRLQLITALDQQLQQSTLETELKVELRKQLLATVSQLKTSETFSEAMLERQLEDYRSAVEGEISENALFAYLYLLKRTPSSTVRDLLVSLDEPAFESFMALCLDAMQDSFRDARRRINENVRLAGN